MTSLSRIFGFRDESRWLSNFWPVPVVLDDGIVYPSVEHAYQAYKIEADPADPENPGLLRRKAIAALDGGGDFEKAGKAAKRAGKKALLRPDWDKVKNDVMNAALEAKFIHNPEMTEKLLATRDYDLIEGNTWHDNYWGDCCCGKCVGQGKNLLGKLIMSIREELFEAAEEE